ncbi:MAG: NAD(P)H-binding protein [Myxococcota bacterium]
MSPSMVQDARSFVAGATGYTGQAVISELRSRGIDAVAHVRPDSARLHEFTTKFETLGATVDTTPWETSAFEETFRRLRPTLVFALLGTTKARARAAAASAEGRSQIAETYEAVDYGLSSLLIGATVSATPSARFVYLSSLGITESTRNPYLRARLRVERELEKSPLDYVSFRPSFITGDDREEDRGGERFAAKATDALLSIGGHLGAGRLRDRYQSVDAAALASHLVDLGLASEPMRRVVQIDEVRAR